MCVEALSQEFSEFVPHNELSDDPKFETGDPKQNEILKFSYKV